MDTFLAGAYWGSRKEPTHSCAKRVSGFFDELSTISETMSEWRLRRRTSQKAGGSIQLDSQSLDQIVEQLEAGLNTKDVGIKEAIPELGFRLGLWNGFETDLEALSLNILCGSYSNSRPYENSVTMTPLLSFDFSDEGLVQDLARAFINTWKPDFFILTTKTALNAVVASADGGQWEPFIDIALYLSDEIAHRHRPDEFSNELVYDDGKLFLNFPR